MLPARGHHRGQHGHSIGASGGECDAGNGADIITLPQGLLSRLFPAAMKTATSPAIWMSTGPLTIIGFGPGDRFIINANGIAPGAACGGMW